MINAKQKYPSLFNHEKQDTDVFKKELENYINDLKNEPFNDGFKDIYFHEYNSSFYYSAFDFIEENDTICFENCHFFFTDITYKGNNIFKDAKVTFKNCKFMSDWNFSFDVNYPNIMLIYEDCTFLNTLTIQNIYSYITFTDCTFNDIELKNSNIKNNIFTNEKDTKNNTKKFNIDNCTFKQRFTLNNYDLEVFTCTNSVFQNKFEFKNNNIIKFDIYNSNFEEISDMFASTFVQFKISKSIFNDFSGFENCIFGTSNTLIEEVAQFEYVTFKDILTLRETKFLSGLDIEKINLQNDANFLKTEVELKNTPRETFRLIKHSFDNIGNTIEANKFYSLEMKKKEDELKNEKSKEWLVFKLHGLASNHSQDWLLSLFWIILIGFISATYDCCFIEAKCTYEIFSEPILYISSCLLITTLIMKYCFNEISKIIILVFTFSLYLFLTLDLKFEYLAKTINPFSVMLSGDNLDIIQFIFKVIIAYLIYQFIISIRQNTRRK